MSRTRAFFSHWQNWLSVILILGFFFVAIAAPFLSPHNPKNPGPFMRVGNAFEASPVPPDEKAFLGQLPFGIDVFHALVWGSRDALQFGLIVTITTSLFGILYGSVSGLAGGRLGGLLLRIADSFLAFPPIAGVVFIQQLFITTIFALGGFYHASSGEVFSFTDTSVSGTLIQSLLERVNPLMLSLILFSWMPYARLVHSIVLTLKQTEFVQASRALGGTFFWIIRKHLLRNSTGPALVLAARDVGGVVLLQATFTFINIGGDSVWGTMLAQGRNWILGPGGNLLTYWWAFLPPTLAVMSFGIAWNLFGDSLNDMLVPAFRYTFRARKSRKEEVQPSPEAESAPPVLTSAAPAVVSSQVRKAVSSDGADPVLGMARAGVSRGDLARALYAYEHLIRHNRSIEDVLLDLARLVKKFPRDPQVWRTLGDALACAGDAEHAAQSYDQARKLM
ncbi:MAG: ABC transporter permease [Anaerolineales bacterium]|nr:ABC transporter permease [Anaerolineales bacterium]